MGIHFYTTNLSDGHILPYYKSVKWACTSILQICHMGMHFYTPNLSDGHTLLYYKSVRWAYTSILQICQMGIHFDTTNLSHGHTLLYYKSVTWAYTSTLQICHMGIHFYTTKLSDRHHNHNTLLYRTVWGNANTVVVTGHTSQQWRAHCISGSTNLSLSTSPRKCTQCGILTVGKTAYPHFHANAPSVVLLQSEN